MEVHEFKVFYDLYARYDISLNKHREGFHVYLVWTCKRPVYEEAMGGDEDHIGVEVVHHKHLNIVEVDIYFKGTHIANEILHMPYAHTTNGSIY